MSQDPTAYVTHAQLDESLEKFGEKLAKKIIDDITDVFSAYVGLIGERFTKLENRFDKLEGRFGKLEKRFDKLEMRLDVVEDKLNKVQSTLDDMKQDNKVQDARIVRLETKIFPQLA